MLRMQSKQARARILCEIRRKCWKNVLQFNVVRFINKGLRSFQSPYCFVDLWESDKLKATRRNTLLSFIRGEYNEKRVQWKIVKYTVGWTVFVNNVERVCIPFCSFLSILSFFFPLRFKFSRNWINDKVERCWKVDNFLDTLSSLLAWINVKWNIFLEVNKNKIFSKNIEINLMKNFDIRVNFK